METYEIVIDGASYQSCQARSRGCLLYVCMYTHVTPQIKVPCEKLGKRELPD